MKCSYGASVAEPVDQIWSTLADVDRVLAALPGTTLTRSGDAVSGTLKCAVGTAQITYRLSALAEIRETEPHTAVVAVTGKEARGGGTLAATLTIALSADGAGTQVAVSGDVQATGRGEAADAEAWSRVLEKLVDSALVTSSRETSSRPAADPAAVPPATVPPATVPPRPALAVAPAPGDFEYVQPGRSGPPPAVVGLVAVMLLLLLRRIRHSRRTRRDNGGSHDE